MVPLAAERRRRTMDPSNSRFANPRGAVDSASMVFEDVDDRAFGYGEHDLVSTAVPRFIGGYRVRERIGEGAMAAIYAAEQERPRRTVALKVMKLGLASRALRERFEAEAETLARLRHPFIPQVFDAGTHRPEPGDGGVGPVPFIVMEHVEAGRPITDYADALVLAVRPRIDLFLGVCDAVEHAHRRGVLHRDLKPTNLLVDAHGEPRVIDFGVARVLDAASAAAEIDEESGQLIGTVQYMSPEQCSAGRAPLDRRSDVYSLAVVLYELLVGRLPYDVRRSPVNEATRVIREARPPLAGELKVELKGELERILRKALSTDREQRYPTAAALASDLRAFVQGSAPAAA